MFQETWQPSHHIQVGKHSLQVDFISFCRTMRKLVTDVKVISGEEYQLFVCDIMIDVPPKSKHKFTRSLKVWKLKDPQTNNLFQEVFNSQVSVSTGVADADTEDIWNNIKTGLLKTTEEVCGIKKPGGGMSMWKRPFLPSRKLSRPGRLVKAWLGHHTMQPKASPDFQFTMPIQQLTRRSMRILTPKSSEVLLPC